jgi:membrane protein YdbS with pleckstrin-like domain
VARDSLWRDGEEVVVSVTPVASGVAVPLVVAVVLATAIVGMTHLLAAVHRVEGWLLLALVGPALLVAATRVVRWRARKVHVTSQRVVVVSGALQRHRRAVELGDIHLVHVSQRLRDRVSLRGEVWLDSPAGALDLGRVRRPSALVRVIDRQRAATAPGQPALDTVFDYEDPAASGSPLEPPWRTVD